jgi:hypothetical protein
MAAQCWVAVEHGSMEPRSLSGVSGGVEFLIGGLRAG